MLVDSNDRFVSQREAPVHGDGHAAASMGSILTVRRAGVEPLVLLSSTRRAPRATSRSGMTRSPPPIRATLRRRGSRRDGRPACRLVAFGGERPGPADPRYSPRARRRDRLRRRLPAPRRAAGIARRPQPRLRASGPDGTLSSHRSSSPVRRPGARTTGPSSPWATWCSMPSSRAHAASSPPGDQVTGAADPNQEPLRTLATFRTVQGKGTMFGVNLGGEGKWCR